jgi:anti-sigma factor RsiW
MSHCEECRSRIDFYLDDELRGDELRSFQSHVNNCAECRKELEVRRTFLEKIRSSRPLYEASEEFRDRISQLLDLEEPVTPRARPAFKRRLEDIRLDTETVAPPPKRRTWARPLTAIAASLFLVASVAVFWKMAERQRKVNSFVDMAVTTHERQVSGRLPIELSSSSEAEVTDWFASKVPFRFRLPSYSQGQKQKDLYKLLGARLVAFKNDYAAYVAYRIGDQPISLLVTSTARAVASGGDSTVSDGITFHSHRKDNLQVITWSVHNLTYAIVSNVAVKGRQSCVICHTDPKDKDLLRGAKKQLSHPLNTRMEAASL